MRLALLSLPVLAAVTFAASNADAKRAQPQVSTATYTSAAPAKPHARRAALHRAPRVAQAHRRPAVSPAS